jgi:hypothetical protein
VSGSKSTAAHTIDLYVLLIAGSSLSANLSAFYSMLILFSISVCAEQFWNENISSRSQVQAGHQPCYLRAKCKSLEKRDSLLYVISGIIGGAVWTAPELLLESRMHSFVLRQLKMSCRG